MSLLNEDALRAELETLAGWSVDAGELVKRYRFASFADGIAFVTRVATLAEEAGHHPDIDIRYSEVTLRLSTHSEGGITQRDVDLAWRADGVAQV